MIYRSHRPSRATLIPHANLFFLSGPGHCTDDHDSEFLSSKLCRGRLCEPGLSWRNVHQYLIRVLAKRGCTAKSLTCRSIRSCESLSSPGWPERVLGDLGGERCYISRVGRYPSNGGGFARAVRCLFVLFKWWSSRAPCLGLARTQPAVPSPRSRVLRRVRGPELQR